MEAEKLKNINLNGLINKNNEKKEFIDKKLFDIREIIMSKKQRALLEIAELDKKILIEQEFMKYGNKKENRNTFKILESKKSMENFKQKKNSFNFGLNLKSQRSKNFL